MKAINSKAANGHPIYGHLQPIVVFLISEGLTYVHPIGWASSPSGWICVLSGDYDLECLKEKFIFPSSIDVIL